MDGKNFKSADYKWQKRIVHFWASWCAPCLIEFPDLMDLSKNNPDNPVFAVAVQDEKEKIKLFLQKNKIAVPDNVIIIDDKDWAITKDIFGVKKLPESVVIDFDNAIASHFKGAKDDWKAFSFDKIP